MGQWLKKDEGLCCLWEAFYSKAFKKAQDMQRQLLERIGEIERIETMAKSNRVDRIKGLGNAVVPAQAREAFKRLMGIK